MDMDAPVSDAGKEKDREKQKVDIEKTTSPGTGVVPTVVQEDKNESAQTGLAKADVATSKVNKTDETTSELSKTDVTTSEVNKTDVATTEVNKTDVATTEVNKAKVATTGVNKTEVATSEVNKTEITKQNAPQTKVVKTEIDKTEDDKLELTSAEMVKTELAKTGVDTTEEEKCQPRVAGSERTAASVQPDAIKQKTEPTPEPDAAIPELTADRNEPEVANIEPEVNKTIPTESGIVSNRSDSSETGQILARPETNCTVTGAAVEKPLGSGSPAGSSAGSSAGLSMESTQRSAMTRTRYSIESDSEISEILRYAPPPTPWEEEDDDGVPSETDGKGTGGEGTGGGGSREGETSGDMETIIIMKKTFTESVMPDQEFIPISEDSDNNASIRNSLPPSLRTLVAPAATSPQKVANNMEKDGGHVVENGADKVTDPEANSDEQSILSKAQMEAQDLTSEFRRLQYLLENLSALGDLELTHSVEPPPAPEPVEQNPKLVSDSTPLKTEQEVVHN